MCDLATPDCLGGWVFMEHFFYQGEVAVFGKWEVEIQCVEMIDGSGEILLGF